MCASKFLEYEYLKILVIIEIYFLNRLGTKLLRVINERKCAKKSVQLNKVEELSLKIIELEHENYSLKDKNVVSENLCDSKMNLIVS